ncbi:MAG TPA: hypothetical protein VJ743_16040, partial [Albitalea sp.]|nr:hypothetical protein [Albitalea sp.]
MAKRSAAFRELKSRALGALLALLCMVVASLRVAAASSGPADASGPAASRVRGVSSLTRVAVARTSGRLSAKDIGLVINTADPYSVAVGEFYIHARKLSARQVLRLALPVQPTLTEEAFDRLKDAIEARFNGDTQALALAWRMPYAVGCNSITGALALGFDPGL